MSLKPTAYQIKKLLKEKGQVSLNPKNGSEAIVIKESSIQDSYSLIIAVGKVRSINSRYFEIQGKVLEDTFQNFNDSLLRINPGEIKKNKQEEYLCAVFDPGLIRKIDEASWADSFNGFKDLIRILKEL